LKPHAFVGPEFEKTCVVPRAVVTDINAQISVPVRFRVMEDPGVDGRIILKWFFEKWDRGAWIGSN
jgi:hypothetical protein